MILLYCAITSDYRPKFYCIRNIVCKGLLANQGVLSIL